MQDKADVIILPELGGKHQRLSLGRQPHRTGISKRYRHVPYHGSQRRRWMWSFIAGPASSQPGC